MALIDILINYYILYIIYYKMNSETIIYCIFAVILGMLVFHMLKNICGCKVIEGQTPCNPSLNPPQICPGGEKCPKTGKCPPYTGPPPPPPQFTNKGPAGSKFTCKYPDAKPGENWCDIPSFISSKEDDGCPGDGPCSTPDIPFRISGGGCAPWAGKNEEPTNTPCYLYWYKGGCLSPETTIQYKSGTVDNIPVIIDEKAKKGEDYGQGQVDYMKWAQENAGCGDPSRSELIEKFINKYNGKYSALKDSKGNYKQIKTLKKGVNPFKWPEQYNCKNFNCDLDNSMNRVDHAGNALKCRSASYSTSGSNVPCSPNTACWVGDISQHFDPTYAKSTGCCFDKSVPSDGDTGLKGKSCCPGKKWDTTFLPIEDDKCVSCTDDDVKKGIPNCGPCKTTGVKCEEDIQCCSNVCQFHGGGEYICK